MARILLLEDETDIRDAVSEYLRLADHRVDAIAEGNAALAQAAESVFDLYLLDVRVPGPSGFEVAKQLRARGVTAPIVFLTARDEEAARITGFELGADDYISKPFSPRELVLRVGAILRRSGGTDIASAGSTAVAELPGKRPDSAAGAGGDPARGAPLRFSCDDHLLLFDPDRHAVMLDGREVATTPTEWRILEWFVANPGRVISRDALLERILGYGETAESRTADTHIKNLRAKLGGFGWIETVRGFGYRFVGEPAHAPGAS